MAFCHTVLNCCTWRLLFFESRGPEWWTSSNIHHPRLLFIPTLYPRSPNPIITVYPYSLLCFYPKFLKPTKLLILISLSLWLHLLHSGASSSLRCKSSSSLHLDSLSTFLNLTPNPHSLSYPFCLPTMQILIHTHPYFHLTHHPHTSSSLTVISNHHSPSDLVLNSSPLLKLSQQKLWYSFTHPHHFDLESSSSLYLKSFWFHHSLLSTFSHLPHSYPTSLSSLHCLFILISDIFFILNPHISEYLLLLCPSYPLSSLSSLDLSRHPDFSPHWAKLPILTWTQIIPQSLKTKFLILILFLLFISTLTQWNLSSSHFISTICPHILSFPKHFALTWANPFPSFSLSWMKIPQNSFTSPFFVH